MQSVSKLTIVSRWWRTRRERVEGRAGGREGRIAARSRRGARPRVLRRSVVACWPPPRTTMQTRSPVRTRRRRDPSSSRTAQPARVPSSCPAPSDPLHSSSSCGRRSKNHPEEHSCTGIVVDTVPV